MDKFKQSLRIIKALSLLEQGELKDYAFIQEVCNFFDLIKEQELSQSDLQFLLYIANKSGIPHYFDFLAKFQTQNSLAIENINLLSFGSLVYDSSLYVNKTQKLHRLQKEILNHFSIDKQNRFFISASTSFGKTFLIYEIIRKMNYKNIVLIFPTIALLSENYERIISDPNYTTLKQKYKIHTLSDIKKEDIKEFNIFIFTPERFLSFLDQFSGNINFDFGLIDEAYKLDNEYLDQSEIKENERDTAYRLAIYWFLKYNLSTDLVMAGPYITFDKNQQNSFHEFIKKNKISILDYNNYNIVQKNIIPISKSFTKNDQSYWPKKNNRTLKQFGPILELISEINYSDGTICFCPRRSDTENLIFGSINFHKINSNLENNDTEFQNFMEHLRKNYIYEGEERIIIKGLEKGVGGHHGLIPKYIQKEIIHYFNKGIIKLLFCTTTITEGVNTSAKNIIIYKAKKGDKELKAFDAKNIEGRAGRFGHHYTGNVYVLDPKFEQAKEQEEDIEHKNYDKNSQKDNIDLFITDEEYLNDTNIVNRNNIEKEFTSRGIDIGIINLYKGIDPLIKIKVFDLISQLSKEEIEIIQSGFKSFNNLILNKSFVRILLLIKQIVPPSLAFYFDTPIGKDNPKIYGMICAYIATGFPGSVKYLKDNLNRSIDKSITETSKFIYTTLKYQFVKYLGVFNIMFKVFVSQKEGKSFEDMAGLERLLRKLEYNAITDKGRKASDYGCPQKVIDYYDADSFIKRARIKNSFDGYENSVFRKIDQIL